MLLQPPVDFQCKVQVLYITYQYLFELVRKRGDLLDLFQLWILPLFSFQKPS